jgi:hypothetical protein
MIAPKRRATHRTGRAPQSRLLMEVLESRLLLSTITVTSLADNTTVDGSVTLREAIQASITHASVDGSTAGTGTDTIVFASGLTGTISLSTIGDTTYGPSAFAISDTLTIDGNNGNSGISIARNSGASNMRLFYIPSGGSLTLNDVTLSGGVAKGGNGGNGNSGGGGAAGLGGAIYNRGTLTVQSSTLTNDQAIGGNGGTGNNPFYAGGGGGGGLGGNGGSTSSSGSGGGGGGPNGGSAGSNGTGGAGGTGGGGGGGSENYASGAGGFGGGGAGNGGVGAGSVGGFGGGGGGGWSGDSSGGFGGGYGQFDNGGGGGGAGMGGAIFNDAGTLTISDSTLASNTATGGTGGGGFTGTGGTGSGLGGAIFNRNGSVSITSSTLSTNTAAQGGRQFYNLGDGAAALASINESILGQSDTTVQDYTGGTINSGSQTGSGSYNVVRTNAGFSGSSTITGDPKLATLASNGGYTQTMAPTAGSSAINAAGSGASIADQRGLTRDAAPDVGALEVASVFTLSTTTANGSYTTGHTIAITVHFGSAVTITGTPTLSLNSGGTANYVSGSGTSAITFNYSVGSTDNAHALDAANTTALTLSGGTIKDADALAAILTLPAPSGAGSLSANASVLIDTTPPTAAISFPAANAVIAPANWTGNFTGTAGDGTGSGVAGVAIDLYDVDTGDYWNGTAFVVSATPISLAVTGTTSWSYPLSVSNLPDGNYAIGVESQDNVGFTSTPTSNFFAIDRVAPTITVGAPSQSAVAGGPLTFGVTYADTNFANSALVASNISLVTTGNANGTISVSGSGTSYTVTVSSITGDGTLGIHIAAGTAHDAAGNAASATSSGNATVDHTAPTITIGAPSSSITTSGPITYSITYADTHFAASTLSLSNLSLITGGNASATIGLSGSGANYTVTLSNITGDGSLGIRVASGTATDTAGNIAPLANSGSVSVDNTAPMITIGAPSSYITASGPITYGVTYADTNFAGSTLTASAIALVATGTANATLSLTGSGANYTVTLSNITGNGLLGFTIASGTATDTAGNSAPAANSTRFAADNTAPTLTFGAPSSAATTTGAITYTATYLDHNFAASTLTTGDLSLITTGTASGTLALAGAGTSYTVTISNITGDGTLAVAADAGTASDAAGNLAPAANSTACIVDNTPPTITISNPATSLVGNDLTFTITYSDANLASITLYNGDISVISSGGTNAAIQSLTQNGNTFTLTMSDSNQTGGVAIQIAPGTATDLAGNAAPGANSTLTTISENADDSIVSAIYHDMLNRGPASSDLTYWDNQLMNGESPEQVANYVTSTPEYRTIEVDNDYTTYFHRTADNAGLNYWLGQLAAGATDAQLKVQFVTSAEYTGLHASSTDFIDALYADMMGRAVVGNEASYWTNLAANGASRTTIADGFTTSLEYDENALNGLYHQMLWRGTDPTGLTAWSNQLLQNGTDPATLIPIFAASPEFVTLAMNNF